MTRGIVPMARRRKSARSLRHHSLVCVATDAAWAVRALLKHTKRHPSFVAPLAMPTKLTCERAAGVRLEPKETVFVLLLFPPEFTEASSQS